MILLMIASFSIPQAVSKLISERIALKDYRNAHKFFKGAMIYAMVIGGVVGLFCLFGAGLIIPQNQKDAFRHFRSWLRRFLSGILGVFRGYFQAYRNMMPTSISQILSRYLMRQSVFWLHGDLSMHSQMEQRTALQNGGQQVPQ